MRSGVAEMRTVHFEGDAFRLIPSRFPPVAVYEGLVANDRHEDLALAESRTNPRLLAEERMRSKYSDPGSPRLQNWNLAPFRYINPEGSRFFGPTRPALELADDRQTALAVSIRRRETFLKRTGEPPIGLDMRMLRTPLCGKFIDLSDLPSELSKDERWKIGAGIGPDVAGLIFTPPERPSARCLAVLRSDVLGRSIQTVHYRFVWNGSRIELVYAFDDVGRELRPEEFARPYDVLSAA